MLRRVFAALTAVALVVLGGAVPAAAHVELEASDPAAGAVLTAAPASLSLTFSSTPITVGVDVMGPDGAPVPVGELVRQGPTVLVPLPPLDQAGGYAVNWRAANDEHPYTGSYTISLDLPTTTTATEPSTTTTSTSEVAATDSLPTGSSGAASDDGGSSTGVALAVAGVLVLVVLGAVVVAARVRRQRPSRATPAAGPGELSPR